MGSDDQLSNLDPKTLYYNRALQAFNDGSLSVEDKIDLALLAKDLGLSESERDEITEKAKEDSSFIENPHTIIEDTYCGDPFNPEQVNKSDDENYQNKFEQMKALQDQFNAYDDNKEYIKCIEVMNKIIDLDPDDPINYVLLGMKLIKVGEYQGALDMYKIAECFLPEDHNLYFLIYDAYVHLREYAKAEENIIKAIELEPSNVFYLHQLMQTKYDLFKLDEAINTANLLLKDNPEDAYAYLIKGISQSELGQVNEALIALKEADRLRPNAVPTNLEIAKAYGLLKQYDKELEHLMIAKNLDPNSGYVLYLIGRSYYAQSKLDDAMDYLTDSLKLDQSNPHAFLYIGLILVTIADDLYDEKNIEEATETANLAFNNLMYATNINGLSEQNFQFADRVINDLCEKYDIRINTESQEDN